MDVKFEKQVNRGFKKKDDYVKKGKYEDVKDTSSDYIEGSQGKQGMPRNVTQEEGEGGVDMEPPGLHEEAGLD